VQRTSSLLIVSHNPPSPTELWGPCSRRIHIGANSNRHASMFYARRPAPR
jgi:hypothetical protein